MAELNFLFHFSLDRVLTGKEKKLSFHWLLPLSLYGCFLSLSRALSLSLSLLRHPYQGLLISFFSSRI